MQRPAPTISRSAGGEPFGKPRLTADTIGERRFVHEQQVIDDFARHAIHHQRDPFFFSGNLTLSDSELTVGESAFNLTNNVRPMSQHSEYVANLQLGFDSPNGAHTLTLAYNTFGERLFFAGRDGAPDAYEQPFDSVDLVYSYFPTERVSMKFRIQNLLDEELEIEQRDIVVLSQSLGTTAKLDVKWDFGN